MRQVAAARPLQRGLPGRGRLGILASGPDLNSFVTGNMRNDPYIILIDFQKDSYAVMGPNPLGTLPGVLQQYNITDLVCNDLSPDTAKTVASQGVMIYGGVSGTAMDAIGLYETNQLAIKN